MQVTMTQHIVLIIILLMWAVNSCGQDSQKTDSQTGGTGDNSQDLFNNSDASNNSSLLQKILLELKTLKDEVAALKRVTNKSFSVENSSFKKQLNEYLKSQFTVYPWLVIQDDLKELITELLKTDGIVGNKGATRTVLSYCSGRYTQFRNQFRRRVSKDMELIKTITLRQLCVLLFKPLCCISDNIFTEEKMKFALLTRAYCQSKQYSLESWCWEEFQHLWKSFLKKSAQIN